MASSDFRAWRMEKAKTAAFCGKALEDALARHGKPEVLNTDKGSQFTGAEASLGGEQDDHSITEMVPGAGSKNQEVVDVANGEYFCLLASALRLYVDGLRAEPNQRQRLRKWVCHTCQTLERTSPVRAIIRPAAASALHRLPFNVVEVHRGNPRLPVI